MMTFFNAAGQNLLILPTHRIVSKLAEFDPAAFLRRVAPAFDYHAYAFGSAAARTAALSRFQAEMNIAADAKRVIGMYAPGAFYVLRLRPEANLAALLPNLSAAQRELDVVLLHRLLLEEGLGITQAAVSGERNITYERELNTAVAAVDRQEAQVCFLLNPIQPDQVTRIALAGEVLPQKSTDFYPKLLSGLTIHRMD
jgi:uncharacterized protein (DUF1015 family)